jgi:hypothetical protein
MIEASSNPFYRGGKWLIDHEREFLESSDQEFTLMLPSSQKNVSYVSDFAILPSIASL